MGAPAPMRRGCGHTPRPSGLPAQAISPLASASGSDPLARRAPGRRGSGSGGCGCRAGSQAHNTGSSTSESPLGARAAAPSGGRVVGERIVLAMTWPALTGVVACALGGPDRQGDRVALPRPSRSRHVRGTTRPRAAASPGNPRARGGRGVLATGGPLVGGPAASECAALRAPGQRRGLSGDPHRDVGRTGPAGASLSCQQDPTTRGGGSSPASCHLAGRWRHRHRASARRSGRLPTRAPPPDRCAPRRAG